jgi:hypothetical protein
METLPIILCNLLETAKSLLPSVVDPECLSRIPEPKTATKERGEKISCHTFFVATNLTKSNFILFF